MLTNTPPALYHAVGNFLSGKSGDVNRHWHGAAKDSWFAHLAFELDGKNTSNEWLEPFSESDYNNL